MAGTALPREIANRKWIHARPVADAASVDLGEPLEKSESHSSVRLHPAARQVLRVQACRVIGHAGDRWVET